MSGKGHSRWRRFWAWWRPALPVLVVVCPVLVMIFKVIYEYLVWRQARG